LKCEGVGCRNKCTSKIINGIVQEHLINQCTWNLIKVNHHSKIINNDLLPLQSFPKEFKKKKDARKILDLGNTSRIGKKMGITSRKKELKKM